MVVLLVGCVDNKKRDGNVSGPGEGNNIIVDRLTNSNILHVFLRVISLVDNERMNGSFSGNIPWHLAKAIVQVWLLFHDFTINQSKASDDRSVTWTSKSPMRSWHLFCWRQGVLNTG